MENVSKRLEDQFSTTLLSLLDDMFASCDDLYFDLASRASSNFEQNLYFESMREVRIKVQSSRNNFQTYLTDAFKKAHSRKIANKTNELKNAKTDELKIVAEEDVEEDVAILSMVSRARAISKKPLFELLQRLKTLYSNEWLSEDENPLDPKVLISTFAKATEHIGIDIKARIILLKQYERIVINRMPEVYTKANALLEQNGIKFKQPRQARVGTGQKSSPFNSANSANSASNDRNESFITDEAQQHYQYSNPSFNELTQLLNTARSSNLNTEYNMPMFASSGNTTISNQQLLSLLDTNQSQALTVNNSNIDLRAVMQKLLQQPQGSKEPVAVEQIDEDVINLVAMFFDFILDDHNIPDNVKALIGRLQMPVLKITLKDKDFFNDSHHDTRKFINEIARISIGITDDSQVAKNLYEKLEAWVHQIQSRTGEIEAAFSDALVELTAYNAQIEKRADLVEKRTSENAQGQAKQQLAKIKAQQAIKESIDGKKIAKPVSEFIVSLWQQALYISLIKYGEDSPEWLANLQTMQDLIWCAQQHKDEKSKQRFQRIRSELKAKLQTGIKKTTFTETQATAQINSICKLIDQLAEGSNETKQNTPEETFDAQNETRLEAANAQKNWSEMTALERQQQKLDALTYEYIEKAETFALGSWFEFKTPSSGTIIRCKLAAKLASSDTYIFVNRFGFKALEKPRKAFAYDLQRNRARQLKTGPIFERSLHKMVSRLKQIS